MAFAYRLEDEAGNPGDPPTFQTAVPNWRAGEVIPLGGRSLRVVEVRTTTRISRLDLWWSRPRRRRGFVASAARLALFGSGHV
jgi:hypothetical protein